MNERIWELAKKAGINLTPAQFSGVLEDEVDEFTLEDFAELIVRECGDVAYRAYWDNPETVKGIYIKEAIREHFGVGE
jgi:hypothetical protein